MARKYLTVAAGLIAASCLASASPAEAVNRQGQTVLQVEGSTPASMEHPGVILEGIALPERADGVRVYLDTGRGTPQYLKSLSKPYGVEKADQFVELPESQVRALKESGTAKAKILLQAIDSQGRPVNGTTASRAVLGEGKEPLR